jgi:hypothetical protein
MCVEMEMLPNCTQFTQRAVGTITSMLPTHTPEQICSQKCPACKTENRDSEIVMYGLMCAPCKGMMTVLKSFAASGIGSDALLRAAHMACDAFPYGRDTCHGWVDKYGNELFDWLNRYSPSTICNKVGAC